MDNLSKMSLKKNSFILAWAFALVLPFLFNISANAQPTEQPDLMVVFDASGSMWGQIDGKSKIQIAQEAFIDLSASWSTSQTRAGLLAYGHRRKGDCSDIELISRPSAEASAIMAEQVAKLKPKGKTPLSAAVRQAADVLKFQEEAATVVLLSDGIETCNLNPCEVGAELEELGINFTAHVIGFDIAIDTDKAQLKCLAENTGGKYFDASDADGLNNALKELATPQTSVSIALPTASVNGPTSVAINDTISVDWSGPAGPEDFIDIQVLGDPRTSNQPSSAKITLGNPVSLQAPGAPGAYELRYVQFKNQQFNVLARSPIQVENRDYVVTSASSGVAGSEIAISWNGKSQPSDYIDIMPVSKGNSTIGAQSYLQVGEVSSGTIELPITPGAYNIRYVLEGAEGRVIKFTKPFEVTQTVATIVAPVSVKPGVDIPVSWTGPQTRGDYVDLVPMGYERTRGELSYFYTKSGKNPASLTAPTEIGDYEIRYILEGANVGRAVIGKTRINVDENAPAAKLPSNSPEIAISIRAQYEDGRVPEGVASWSFYKTGALDVRAPVTPSGDAIFEAFEYGHYRAEVIVETNGGSARGEADFTLEKDGTTEFYITIDLETPGDNQSANDVKKGSEKASKDGGEEASSMISEEELAAEKSTMNFEPTQPLKVDVWAQCVGRSACHFTHQETKISWSLPPDWVAEEPYLYTTAGGSKAEHPTVSMILRPANNPFRVELNPRQWSDMLGPCEDIARGLLCRTTPVEARDFPDYELIRTGLMEVSGTRSLTSQEINEFLNTLSGK